MDIVESVLLLLAGIGVFLVGIVFFSDTLTKSASGRMRVLFRKISGNRAAGFGLGVGVTVASQSSTVSTVIVVGLVNAGLLTLFQAAPIIFGANVGSALTAIMISLSTLPIKYFFMSFAFIGAFMKLVTKNGKVTFIANLLLGFGVIFVGLDIMSSAFKGARGEGLSNAFTSLFKSVDFPLLLILFGIIFTLITNSSMATTAIIVSLMAADLLTFKSGMFLILGANIGTSGTALLASLTANTNAKRAAMIHFLFNFIGVVIFVIILWPLQSVFVPWYTKLIPGSVWQIAVFHVIFNVVTALILIWFIKPMIRFVTWLLKEAPKEIEILRTTYINQDLDDDLNMNFANVVKEMKEMTEYTIEAMNLAYSDLIKRDFENKEKITKDKVRIDFLHQEITQYLVKLSSMKLTASDSQLIGEYYRFTTDIKRMAGHSIFMTNNTFKMKENGLKFSQDILDDLDGVYAKIKNLFELFLKMFESEKSAENLKNTTKLGTELKRYCDKFSDGYLDKLAKEQFNVELGEVYYASMISFRSIASYITSMAVTLHQKMVEV